MLFVVYVSRKNIFNLCCMSSFSFLIFYGYPAQWCAFTNSSTPKAYEIKAKKCVVVLFNLHFFQSWAHHSYILSEHSKAMSDL